MEFPAPTDRISDQLLPARGQAVPEHNPQDSQRCWTAPPPSESYEWAKKIELQEERRQMPPMEFPQELKEDLDILKDELKKDEDIKQREKLEKASCEPPRNPYKLTTIEEGGGCLSRQPAAGTMVLCGYIVVLEDGEEIVDKNESFEYTVGEKRPIGVVWSQALDAALVEMKRGGKSSMKCTLSDLFDPEAPLLNAKDPSEPCVMEVSLQEIYVQRDCSLVKDSGVVTKEAIKDGVGYWCDNPTDLGTAVLSIDEIRTEDGTKLFPGPNEDPKILELIPGQGQVCDALEAACLEMRKHEQALITCNEPMQCVGGDEPFMTEPPSGPVVFKVTLLDYEKGPEVWKFDDHERLDYAYKRKENAGNLYKKGRYFLAQYMYQKIIDLFEYVYHTKDGPNKFNERYWGKADLLNEIKELHRTCLLNNALTSLKLRDPVMAKRDCDRVLKQKPETLKALFIRARSFCMRRDWVQARKDLQTLLDIDPDVEEAKTLIEQVQKWSKAADKEQEHDGKTMLKGLKDHRSIKFSYMDIPMDMSNWPGHEQKSKKKKRQHEKNQQKLKEAHK